MRINLINIQNEITQQVDEYLQKYYEKDSISSSLIDYILDYLNTCRYSQSKHDDVRPLFTKLGYEIASENDNVEYILPAMRERGGYIYPQATTACRRRFPTRIISITANAAWNWAVESVVSNVPLRK